METNKTTRPYCDLTEDIRSYSARRVIFGGELIKNVAASIGVASKTVGRWCAKYRADHEEARS